MLIADLDNTHRNRPRSTSATSSFSMGIRIADASRAGPSAVAINYFCYRDDRLALRRDRFAIDCLDVGETPWLERFETIPGNRFSRENVGSRVATK